MNNVIFRDTRKDQYPKGKEYLSMYELIDYEKNVKAKLVNCAGSVEIVNLGGDFFDRAAFEIIHMDDARVNDFRKLTLAFDLIKSRTGRDWGAKEDKIEQCDIDKFKACDHIIGLADGVAIYEKLYNDEFVLDVNFGVCPLCTMVFSTWSDPYRNR